MGAQNGDPLWRVAEQVADCLSERGYAFVEDDKLESLAAVLRSFLTALAAVLRSFLTATGIPVSAVDARGEAPTAAGNSSASVLSSQSEPLRAGRYPASGTAP